MQFGENGHLLKYADKLAFVFLSYPIKIYFCTEKQIIMEIVNIEAQTFYKMNGMLENLVLLIKESQMCLHRLDEWLDNQDVCLMTGISIGTLTMWRRSGKIPHSRIDRKVYYKKQDVIDFIVKRLQNKN